MYKGATNIIESVGLVDSLVEHLNVFLTLPYDNDSV